MGSIFSKFSKNEVIVGGVGYLNILFKGDLCKCFYLFIVLSKQEGPVIEKIKAGFLNEPIEWWRNLIERF
jgi:hypothetical protein